MKKTDQVTFSREGLEVVLRQAFRTGWEVGSKGSPVPPDPVFNWADGIPLLASLWPDGNTPPD